VTTVLTLLVRDESDIVELNVRFHLDAGVDFVVVTDNGSVDGTREILAALERELPVRVIDEPSDDYSQHRWVTRMARLAAAEHAADWVINADADEFWWPADGSLAEVFAAVPSDVGGLAVSRENFLIRPEDGRPFWERLVVRRTDGVNEVGDTLNPKVCHRGDPEVEVGQGNHEATGPRIGSVQSTSAIDILHFPMRTYAQFVNKIDKGGAAYARNTEFPTSIGHRWRELHADLHAGGLADRWRSWEPPEEEVQAGLASGLFVVDTRLRDWSRDHLG
jgi:hypothetical protein